MVPLGSALLMDVRRIRFRQKALEKSEAIEYNVGHPDELLNDTLVAKYYEGWDVSEDGYIQNYINGKAFDVNKDFKMLFHDPLDKKNWMLQLMDNAEVQVNAGNQIAANIISEYWLPLKGKVLHSEMSPGHPD